MFMDYLMISKIKLTLNKENTLPCLKETKLLVLLNKNSELLKFLKVLLLLAPPHSTKLLVHTLKQELKLILMLLFKTLLMIDLLLLLLPTSETCNTTFSTRELLITLPLDKPSLVPLTSLTNL